LRTVRVPHLRRYRRSLPPSTCRGRACAALCTQTEPRAALPPTAHRSRPSGSTHLGDRRQLRDPRTWTVSTAIIGGTAPPEPSSTSHERIPPKRCLAAPEQQGALLMGSVSEPRPLVRSATGPPGRPRQTARAVGHVQDVHQSGMLVGEKIHVLHLHRAAWPCNVDNSCRGIAVLPRWRKSAVRRDGFT